MPQNISYTDNCTRGDESVSVIASFDTQGHVKPLYVRIGDVSLKVVSSWIASPDTIIMEFKCQVEDGEYLKPLTIFYYTRENVWRTPKKPRS